MEIWSGSIIQNNCVCESIDSHQINDQYSDRDESVGRVGLVMVVALKSRVCVQHRRRGKYVLLIFVTVFISLTKKRQTRDGLSVAAKE